VVENKEVALVGEALLYLRTSSNPDGQFNETLQTFKSGSQIKSGRVLAGVIASG